MRALIVAGAVAAASAAAFLTPALAAPVGNVGATDPMAQTLIEKAGYRRCAKWNYICRDRWVAGWKYRRCMRRHGC